MRFWSIALVLVVPFAAAAQDPDYTFILSSASASPGGSVNLDVFFDDPNASESLQGWSYGVANGAAERQTASRVSNVSLLR